MKSNEKVMARKAYRQNVLSVILSKINWTQVIMGLIGLATLTIGFRQNSAINKQEERDSTQKRTAKWDSTYKQKNDLRWDSLFRTLKRKK